MHVLVNQLLDFKSFDDNRKIVLDEANVCHVVEQAAHEFKLMSRINEINFQLSLPERPVMSYIDSDGYMKIANNLMSNAFKYTRNMVCVTLSKVGNNFVLEVANNGPKIETENLTRIFDPFVRLEGNAARKVEGSGIGLAYVKYAVERAGGSVGVVSTDQLTTFTVTLPVKDRPQPEVDDQEQVADSDLSVESPATESDRPAAESADYVANPIDAAEQSGENGAKSVILIVEDNDDMRNFIKGKLGQSFVTITAVDGLDAVEKLNNNVVDLVVSDIMMDRMDGFELCREIRRQPLLCHLPIILLTAKTDMDSKSQGMANGADIYLEKPFSMEFLKLQINSLIKNRAMVRDLYQRSPFLLPQSIAQNSSDLKFLNRVNETIMANLNESSNLIDIIADKLSVSRSSLHKKLKAVTGMTPNDYIHLARLKKAAELLKSGEYRINEISFMVGFNTPSYFAKCFRAQFGMLPRDFVRKNSDNPSEEVDNESDTVCGGGGKI